jgi:predicted nicotinamide N-methyase
MSKPKIVVDAFGTLALTASHPEVKKLKRLDKTPSMHGNKVWGSSFVIMDYFIENPLADNKNVLDVGCGWGLTGVFLAKTYNATVIGMDADSAVAPYLNLHADINEVNVRFEKKRFQQINKADFTNVHTVIGADICFWEELTKPLYHMIKRALNAGVTQIIIGDPGRQPFYDLAQLCEDTLPNTINTTRRITAPKTSTKSLLVIKNTKLS